MKRACSWIKKALVALLALTFLSLSLGGCGSTSPRERNLLTVSVQPATAEATAPSGSAPFTATGTYDQAPTTQDLTVLWSSSNPMVATINGNSGVATCIATGGPVTITASLGQKTGTAQLDCVASPQPGSGYCAYQCGSTRCGALTGYCSISSNNQCRQVAAGAQCLAGTPAGATATDGCGLGVDTSRPCDQ